MTVGKWWVRWFPPVDLAPSTLEAYAQQYRRHVGPRFARVRLDEVSALELAQFARGLREQGLAPSSVAVAMSVIRDLLADAAVEGLIPVARVRRRAGQGPPVRVGVAVDLGTLVALGECLPTQESLMVIVAAFTGMRWGEVCGMRAGFLRLQPAGLGVGGGVYEVDARFGAVDEGVHSRRYFGPPKGGRGRVIDSGKPSCGGWIVPTKSKDRAGRVPPADVTGIRLSYRLSTRWDEDPSDGPSFWHVSADVWGLEEEAATDHVGSFVFYRIEPLETDDLFGVMDGYDSDLGHIAEMIIDPETGEIIDELRDRLAGLESDVLVLCRAELEEHWRGFGIGAVLAGQAIKQLGHGCLAVALQPASLLPRPGKDEKARQRAVEKIAKVWEKIGFTPVGEDLMVLDLATTAFSKSLERQSALARRLSFAADDD